MDLLGDMNIQLNGRQGQPQCGVDVFGKDGNSDELYGIQCKGKNINYGQKVTENELLKEVQKAKNFQPRKLDIFILATTAPNDQKLQQLAREITEKHKAQGLFKVYVYGWDELAQRLPSSPKACEKFYPGFVVDFKKLSSVTDEILGTVKNIEAQLSISPTNISCLTRAQITDKFKNSSYGLISWPNTLRVDNSWICRKEEQAINIIFDNQFSSTTIILGEPGTGKSALLSRIAQQLIGEKEIVLAIKADQLDGTIKNFQDLGIILGLPDPIDKCVIAASKFGKTFIFIDQLDTLSELIDVKTERLSVLLSLINQLSGRPNIHIIASSRPFEFKHDARFSTIKANEIRLPNLEWDAVASSLKSNGVSLISPDEAFKRFLCRPSNLNFYLSYVKNNPTRAFASHLELYEDIWSNSTGSEPHRTRRRELLLGIATIMTNDAKQTLPLLNYDEYSDDIGWLVDMGLLVKTNNSRSISFAHQTLQAFVWTRSFIKHNKSVYDFIILHQNNLNIRPKLSTVLLYLRDADTEEYKRQIQKILIEQRTNVRKHIQHLTVDCITAHADPSKTEFDLISQLIFDDEFRIRIINSIRGKGDWFDLITSSLLNKMMKESSGLIYSSAFLLSGIYHQRSQTVLSFIKENWIGEENIEYVFHFLRQIDNWDEELFQLAKDVIQFKQKYPNAASHLFYIIEKKSPLYALKLASSYFENEMIRLIANPECIPPISDEASETDRVIHQITHDPRRPFERLMTFSEDWYTLSETAAKYPKEFIDLFWPTFVVGCQQTQQKPYFNEHSYHVSSGTWFNISDDNSSYADRYLSRILEQSLVKFAQCGPLAFIDFFDVNKSHPQLPIHRLLAKGLIAIASEFSSVALEYLLADERRFRIGHSNDYHSGTIELISSIAPQLDQQELTNLHCSIRGYKARKPYPERTPEGKKWDLVHNRRVRYSLMSAIPKTIREQAATRQLQEDERALGANIRLTNGYSGLVRATSPMTCEQMSKAKDESIYQCFLSFNDKRDDDWPIRDTYISATELAREFEKFAEQYPLRAATIILRFDENNINATSHGIVGLSKSEYAFDKLLDLIQTKDMQQSVSTMYADAARAINSRLSDTCILSEEWLKRITNWLIITEKTEQPINKEKEEQIESILWGDRTTYFGAEDNYIILDCVTRAMFLHPNKLMIKEWANLIITHIKRNDRSSIWSAMLAIHFPRALRLCEKKDAESILNLMIAAYPELLDDPFLGRNLVRAIHWADDESFFNWMGKLLARPSNKSCQLYGELLVAKRVIHPDNIEAQTLIDKSLSFNVNTYVLYGIAYALKNTWSDHSDVTTGYVVRLLGLGNDEISSILLGILNTRDQLEPTPEINELLDAFIKNRTVEFKNERIPFLAKSLSYLTTKEPTRIAELSNQLITSWGRQLADIRSAAVSETPDLINISITLHNLGPSFQSIGLDIFERLIELDAYTIQDVLIKIDGNPIVIMSQ
jgi:hypothetical protein